MTIACLGWGSLIWDPREFQDCFHTPWQGDGPSLPVEFTRHSRGDRLTLVLTPGAKQLPVLWVKMKSNRVNDCMKALAKRENCGMEHIASLGHPTKTFASEEKIMKRISRWADKKGFYDVIWTALPSRFDGKDGNVPTVKEALDYLNKLNDVTEAERYIRHAPQQIKTKYRKNFEEELGWKFSKSNN